MKLHVQADLKSKLFVNFAVDPEVLRLPEGYSPQLVDEKAVGKLSVLHARNLKPHPSAPPVPGWEPRSVAYQVSVVTPEGKPASFAYRRFTDSWVPHLAGGVLFPGKQELARIQGSESMGALEVRMLQDTSEHLHVKVTGPAEFESKLFPDVATAGEFFRSAHVVYTAAADGAGVDGVELRVSPWNVAPVKVETLDSSWVNSFPAGSVELDGALLMQNVFAEWIPVRR